MDKSFKVIIGSIVLFLILFSVYFIFHDNKDLSKPRSEIIKKTQSTTGEVNNSVVITKNNQKLGFYLAEPNGSTLYVYSADKSGNSYCSSSCLSIWPAYIEMKSKTELPSNIGTLTRKDNGKSQYTYKSKALYTFSTDKIGQVSGNGISGFSVARP